MGRKIGLLGGTFNPIHKGHLALGEEALKQLGLDEVWFMPSGQTNFKKDLYILPREERGALIELSIKQNPSFRLSDIELKRPGTTYTYETLQELKELYPEDTFYFILGADCLFSIEKWREPLLIMSNAVLVSALRGDADKPALIQQAKHLEEKFGTQIMLLNFSKMDISSSEIRAKLSKRESISDLVPKEVEDYINKHSFYQGKATI